MLGGVDLFNLALVIIAVVVVAAVAVVAAMQIGWLPRALPLVMPGRGRGAVEPRVRVLPEPGDGIVQPTAGNAVALREPPARVAAELSPPWEDWREELRALLNGSERGLASLQQSIDHRIDSMTRRLDGLAGDVSVARGLVEMLPKRQDAALEGLRSELAARDRESRHERTWLGERRAEMAAELYLRLARLEAAIAAVTNPVLLPGEPYAPPTEFLAEALTWDNWKDVGERAFAFADTFSARRLYLTEPTCHDVANFVTLLRGLLTRSIYPNLRPDPSPAQQQALRAALETLAAELPRLRGALEHEFRVATFQSTSDRMSPIMSQIDG